MKKNMLKGLLAASLMAMLLCGCGKETVATESQAVAAAGTSEAAESSQAEETVESSEAEEPAESTEETSEEETKEEETKETESTEAPEESQSESSEPAATEKPAATATPQVESTESAAPEETPAPTPEPTPAPTPKPAADCSNGHADPGMCVESGFVDDTHMRMVTHEFCRACGWESYTVDSSRMDPDTFVLYSEGITHDPVPHNCSR